MQSRNDGYRALVDKYGNYVYTIVMNRLRGRASPEDIEECVCDVFTDVVLSAGRYSFDEGSLKGFVSTVAVRKSVDAVRKLSSVSTLSIDAEDAPELVSESDTEKYAEEREQSRSLWNEVRKLGEPDSTILILQYFYRKPAGEIAEHLKMSVDAVYKRSVRARDKLRKMIGKGDGIPV